MSSPVRGGLSPIHDKLPHRYPLLMVDRIVAYEPPAYLIGVKNVTANEPWFSRDNSSLAVFPHVLVLEAMSQCCGILAHGSLNSEATPATGFLAGIRTARFRKAIAASRQLGMAPITTAAL